MATATYEYKVRDRTGSIKTGTLDAESQAQVASKLRSMGYAPMSIAVTNSGLKKELKIPGMGAPKIKLKDLAVFSRQFATMINAGLSLLRALTILTEQTDNKELARVLGEVRNDIESGNSLSQGMAKFPAVFPPLMVNMCRAGEVGGFLDTVLLQVANNYEAETKPRGKVKSAMTYPVVVLCIALLAVVGMLLFIVPTLRRSVQDPRRHVAAADSDPGDDVEPAQDRCHPDHCADYRRAAGLEARQTHPAGTQRCGSAQAEAAGVRRTIPKDRADTLLPELGHNDEVRSAHSAEFGHRRGDDGQRRSRASHPRRTGECPDR